MNLFRMPAGCLPVTHVKANEQFYDDEFKDPYTKSLAFNMDNSQGLPVGIQVVGRVWEDEACLKLMALIENLVKFEKWYKL